MNPVQKTPRAAAYMHLDFLSIETESGYSSARSDPKGVQRLLDPNSSDELLGAALSEALSKSRFVLSGPRSDVWIHPEAEFDSDLYDPVKSKARYEAWKASLMERYGYKTPRALFKGMKSCSIKSLNGSIKITPTHHESLEGWGRTKGDGIEDVVIPASSTPAEIGAALRLAFSRCTE